MKTKLCEPWSPIVGNYDNEKIDNHDTTMNNHEDKVTDNHDTDIVCNDEVIK